MSSRMTSGIGANKWDDPTITSIGCGQQLRDSRWGRWDSVQSLRTQPKKESGLESLIGVYGVRLLGAKMEIRLMSFLD